MKRIWRSALGAGIVLISAVACSAPRSAGRQETAPAAGKGAPARHTIMIDPQIREAFAPAPESAAPKLTAQQAWSRYAAVNGVRATAIPSGVTVRLGLLTLPAGPADAPGASKLAISNGEAYTALNELVYGYSSPSPCVYLDSHSHSHCIEWDFLNANSGKQIESTWQKIGH